MYAPAQRHRTSLEDSQRSTISEGSRRSSGSDRSDKSTFSQSTVPTEYDYATSKLNHHDNGYRYEDEDEDVYEEQSTSHPAYPSEYTEGPVEDIDARVSVDTYASTIPSLSGDASEDVEDDFQIPDFQPYYYSDTVPTTPADFSKLFPSRRKLSISHDDSTPDGNMNLKINTQVRTPKGRMQNMTLFHLRMYDLKSREFSLRRYDRDSGREVCHSLRKYQKPNDQKRPGLQRSLSNAFASLRTKSDNRMPTLSTVSRSESRHGSKKSFDIEALEERPSSSGHDGRSHPQIPTNTTRLEFSNYAHVEVKRRGAKSSKRYEFEYWGITYLWKRVVNKNGKDIQTSYHLFRAGESTTLANIVPEPLSPTQQREESEKGGWVPPCAMWISDERLLHMQNDVSDVIITSGLVALVDDCIKRRFHSKTKSSHGLALPRIKLHTGSSPKQTFSDRIGRAHKSPPTHTTPRGPTPLRQTSY